MKRSLALIAVALSLAASGVVAAIAVAGGSVDPTSQWAAPKVVQRSFVGHPFEVMTCSQACNFYNGQVIGEVQTFKIGVVSAQVRGLGRAKLFNGVRRYQYFEARVCGLDYLDGGARVSAHFVWYTRRAARKTTTTNPNGTISGTEDSGTPYAVDWEQRGLVPLAHSGC